MAERRVESELFVGREKELQLFEKVIAPNSKVNILNVHTDGKGGVGKTQLLLKMQERCAELEERVVFSSELIDFYHTESHTRIGVMLQIVENLGSENFPGFTTLIGQYQTILDASKRTELLPITESVFQKEYTAFARQLKDKEKKTIVLFFDTYEAIQGTKVESGIHLEEGYDFSHWLETELFPALAENTKLVVSGRKPVQEIARSKLAYEDCVVSNFNLDDTKAFWKRCFSEYNNETISSDEHLIRKIGSREILETIYNLTEGRPILLALFIDWMNYKNKKLLSPEVLCREIEVKSGEDIRKLSEKQKELFEQVLIGRFASLIEPEDRAVTMMAIAYRRMTPDMFAILSSISLEECREILLKRLKPLSFIKYKKGLSFELTEKSLEDLRLKGLQEGLLEKLLPLLLLRFRKEDELWAAVIEKVGSDKVLEHKKNIIESAQQDVVLLHDVMRNMVVKLWWETSDPEKNFRKDYSERLVRYYDGKLLSSDKAIFEEEREVYGSEALEYAFMTDAKKGTERFCGEFDIAMENGRYDYSDQLLREAESFQRNNPIDVPLHESLEIKRRRVKYTIDRHGNHRGALQQIARIFNRSRGLAGWKSSNVQGYLFLLKGQAEFWSGEFEKSFESFLEAKRIFYGFNLDLELYRAANWIGYLFYRQGNFEQATRWWLDSRKGFFRVLEREKLNENQIRFLIQGFQSTLGNLSVTYRLTGQSNRAIQLAEMLLNVIYLLPRNNREIARSRITACYVLEFAGYTVDAAHHARKAGELLEDLHDPLLQGRLKTNLGWLHYRTRELTYLLAFFHGKNFERIVEGSRFISPKELAEATQSISDAIHSLREMENPIAKEMADAHYALGEGYMITPSSVSTDHWKQAETAFEESLKWGEKSGFKYRIFDTWVRLITLYYFWNYADGVSDERKEDNEKKIQAYREKIESYSGPRYPNLLGAYEITLGNADFDRALEELQAKTDKKVDIALFDLQKAFMHFANAVGYLQEFNEERHYLALRLFHSRLNIVIDRFQENQLSSEEILRLLNDLLRWIRGRSEKLDELLRSAFIRVAPQKESEQFRDLEARIRKSLDDSDFEWTLILSDCMIEVYKALLKADPQNDGYREEIILRLNAQARYYRILRDDYHASRCVAAARRQLEEISDELLKKSLEAYCESTTGGLEYRRGEYGRLLEVFLWDELRWARERFDRQFPKARERAVGLLRSAEQKFMEVIPQLQKDLDETENADRKTCLETQILRCYKNLGEARFRLGELFMLEDRYEDEDGEKGAFTYLKESMDDAERGGDGYRHDDAVESYVTALYFSGKSGLEEELKQYENLLDQKRLEGKVYPTVLGRLRITQGDALFSQCFKQVSETEGVYYYDPVFSDIEDVKTELRRMVLFYVEACNFMAQARHEAAYFSTAIRVLQRRIELISDSGALEVIEDALRDAWSNQAFLLVDKDEDLTGLVELAKIRSVMQK